MVLKKIVRNCTSPSVLRNGGVGKDNHVLLVKIKILPIVYKKNNMLCRKLTNPRVKNNYEYLNESISRLFFCNLKEKIMENTNTTGISISTHEEKKEGKNFVAEMTRLRF